MTHPAVLTGSLSLQDFNIAVYGDPIEVAGQMSYRIRLHARRANEWVLVGAISLSPGEWMQLSRVFQAHEAQHEKLPAA
jgi:hypothetical protein